MKTKASLIFPALLAVCLAGWAGCESPESNSASATPRPGPLTRAVTLSNLKTYDVVKKNATDTAVPTNDVLVQTVREEVNAKGYQPALSTSPDFLISVGWAWVEEPVSSTPPGPPIAKSDTITLSIIVKDSISGDTLWTSPPGLAQLNAKSITADDAKVVVRKAMKDFPPSQP